MNTHYTNLPKDELTELLRQMTFQIHHFELWEGTETSTYISTDLELIYFESGKMDVVIDHKQYECLPGTLFIIKPFQFNQLINQQKNCYRFYRFRIEVMPYHIKEQFLAILTRHGQVIYPNEIHKYNETFKRLFIEFQNQKLGYHSVIIAALIRIFIQIIRIQLIKREDEGIRIFHSPYIQLISEALLYIQENIHQSIRIQTLSQSLGVSSSYLYKAFMYTLSISPATYIQQQKILYAQKMLMEGKNVTEISQDLNYSSPYHLSKVFKTMTGMSPREYKKKMNMK